MQYVKTILIKKISFYYMYQYMQIGDTFSYKETSIVKKDFAYCNKIFVMNESISITTYNNWSIKALQYRSTKASADFVYGKKTSWPPNLIPTIINHFPNSFRLANSSHYSKPNGSLWHNILGQHHHHGISGCLVPFSIAEPHHQAL
jgi:hypothetical protein